MRGEWYQGGEGNENERRYRINRRGVEYDYEEWDQGGEGNENERRGGGGLGIWEMRGE